MVEPCLWHRGRSREHQVDKTTLERFEAAVAATNKS
jgi:hypothetical protein